MKEIIKKIVWILDTPFRWLEEAINDGLVDHGGQGRDKYGR